MKNVLDGLEAESRLNDQLGHQTLHHQIFLRQNLKSKVYATLLDSVEVSKEVVEEWRTISADTLE